MPASRLRREFRLRTSVSKIVRRSADWHISRGGIALRALEARCRAKAIEGAEKSWGNPKRRRSLVRDGMSAYLGVELLFESSSPPRMAHGTSSGFSPPPLPPRPRVSSHRVVGSELQRRSPGGDSGLRCGEPSLSHTPTATKNFSYGVPVSRKVRYARRKLTWCTTAANVFVASRTLQTIADDLGEGRLNCRSIGWKKSVQRYRNLRRTFRKLGIDRDWMMQQPIRTVGALALLSPHLAGFLHCYSTSSADWEHDFDVNPEPTCICHYGGIGFQVRTCSVHKKKRAPLKKSKGKGRRR